ncbi:hypothetical protein J7L13_01295, partial [bacterium]|nr:hypothetical protein [bacterium]
KARELIEKAVQYAPEYRDAYYAIEIAVSPPSIEELYCILDKLGLLHGTPEWKVPTPKLPIKSVEKKVMGYVPV